LSGVIRATTGFSCPLASIATATLCFDVNWLPSCRVDRSVNS
jgi:hypothetical protein